MKPQERLFRYYSTRLGNWTETYDVDDGRFRYYWRGIRVPWIAWATLT